MQTQGGSDLPPTRGRWHFCKKMTEGVISAVVFCGFDFLSVGVGDPDDPTPSGADADFLRRDVGITPYTDLSVTEGRGILQRKNTQTYAKICGSRKKHGLSMTGSP